MAKIDYESARQMLAGNFAEVERAHIDGSEPPADQDVIAAYDRLFRSRTQAYREVLLGCIVAKLQEPAIDVRLPYQWSFSSFHRWAKEGYCASDWLCGCTSAVPERPKFDEIRGTVGE
jgi:hypothetical protein